MGDEETRKAFLRGIEADRSNYDKRIYYAEWLDDQGEHEEAERQRNYEAAEKWLIQFAADCGVTDKNYHNILIPAPDRYGFTVNPSYVPDEQPIGLADVIQAGWDCVNHGRHFVQMGSEGARDLIHKGDNCRKFWEAWQTVTGHKVSEEMYEERVFSCSC